MAYRKCIYDASEGKIKSTALIPWFWRSAWFMDKDEVVLRSNLMKLRLPNSQIKSIAYDSISPTSGQLSIELKDHTKTINFGVINRASWSDLKEKYAQRFRFIDAAI